MKFHNDLNFNDLIGHHALLHGETNTKKTYYTAKFVQFLVESKKIDPKEISLLDFAPKLSIIKKLKIGGKIQDYYEDCNKCNTFTFEGEIIPPRLKATNLKELYNNACQNYKKTSKILQKFNENPTLFLIINDISIYLHLGSKKYLLETIKKASTFFGNTYHGTSIKRDFATLFSLREKKLVEHLINNIEFSFFTG